MLRECFRVLRPGGRLAVVSIEARPGLDEAGLARAAELGPADVAAPAPLEELVAVADFRVEEVRDLTAAYEETLLRLLRGLASREDRLRALEGDEAFDYEVERRQGMLEAVRGGLIARTMVSARR